MRWIKLIVVACLLLVGVCSLVACTGGQEKYDYYMNLANQYETACVAEAQQADYYFNLARGLQESGLNIGEQTYEELVSLGKAHQENAVKYCEKAEEYKRLASQHRQGFLPF